MKMDNRSLVLGKSADIALGKFCEAGGRTG
jgi:hypothetical protein